jgi:hypothetical protein
MLQFIIGEEQHYPFQEKSLKVCECNCKDSFDLSEYDELLKSKQEILAEGESADIYDWDSLIKFGKTILESKVLGVDLEGHLRRGGTVEMVQINNYRNTFLIDFYTLF